jgi:uncharacterized membrane protein
MKLRFYLLILLYAGIITGAFYLFGFYLGLALLIIVSFSVLNGNRRYNVVNNPIYHEEDCNIYHDDTWDVTHR